MVTGHMQYLNHALEDFCPYFHVSAKCYKSIRVVSSIQG